MARLSPLKTGKRDMDGVSGCAPFLLKAGVYSFAMKMKAGASFSLVGRVVSA